MQVTTRHWHAAMPALVFFAVLLAQLPLILNPGYFSHDELQWAVRADDGHAFPWLGSDAFQYRPLTFNLWMWLSRHLFAQPQAFHAVLVAWGAGNAALLFAVGRRFGVRAWPAAFGALSFALGPYAAYVHGWVGTLADLVWVACALVLACTVQRTRNVAIAAAAAALLTATALLAKEAAFAIPPMLAVAWWFDGRKRTWLVATLAAGAVAALFLGFRFDALMHAPREGAQYALSLASVPLRWLEYQLFPPIFPLLETFTTFQRGFGWHIAIAGLLWLGLLAALWRAGPRYAAVFLLGGIAALLPVLPMGSSWNQYAYGFAALASMCVAAAWSATTRAGRAAIVLFALLNLLHGLNVARVMHAVGEAQAKFSPALADVLRQGGSPVRLRASPDAKSWVFQRLTHQIPRYDGVEIGARVSLVEAPAEADYEIQPDGSLRPLR